MTLILSVLSHSAVSDSFAALWTVDGQAPLSMEFPKQEYWSGLPFPTRGDLPDPGIKSMSLASPALAGRFLPLVPPGSPCHSLDLLESSPEALSDFSDVSQEVKDKSPQLEEKSHRDRVSPLNTVNMLEVSRRKHPHCLNSFHNGVPYV